VRVMIVMPTYNEAENLPLMVSELFSLGIEGLELLIIDDNSPDGTGDLAEALARERPGKIQVIHRQGKLGLGTAYVTGFRHALSVGADYVFEMDADFSHKPSYIPEMLEAARDSDVVVGSRYIPGGGVDANWSPWRRFLSWWGNSIYARLILGLQVHDSTAGFKCFRRSALESLDLDRISSQGYAFQVEVAYACQRNGLRVKEIPIIFPDRIRGKSKMSANIGLEAAWRVWEIKWRYSIGGGR